MSNIEASAHNASKNLKHETVSARDAIERAIEETDSAYVADQLRQALRSMRNIDEIANTLHSDEIEAAEVAKASRIAVRAKARRMARRAAKVSA